MANLKRKKDEALNCQAAGQWSAFLIDYAGVCEIYEYMNFLRYLSSF
jgi:hypothetical protein